MEFIRPSLIERSGARGGGQPLQLKLFLLGLLARGFLRGLFLG